MRFIRNYSLITVVLFSVHCAPSFSQVICRPCQKAHQVVNSGTVTLPPAPIDSFPYSPLRSQTAPAGKKQEAIVEAPIDADYALPVAPEELVSTKLPRPNVMLPGAVRAPQWNFGRTLKLARIRPITNPGG